MSLNQLNWRAEDYDGLFEKEVPSKLLNKALLQKDIWRTREDLGLETDEHRQILTINFSKIRPSWFNLLAKLYVLTRANLKFAIDYIRSDITHFNKFAKFLREKGIKDVQDIDNKLFEQFDYWIHLTEIKESTIAAHYKSLNNFFNTCRLEGWLDINTYWFKGKTWIHKNGEINYIPEEVWNQLESNLHHFPKPMQRKVLIIRTLGLRIGELLNLPLDCLRKRGRQWRLRLETEKFKREDELPVPLDLVLIIKEQQEYIRENFGESYKKLFCSNKDGGKKIQGVQNFNFTPVAKVMHGNTFNRWLNQLAAQCNICSKDGKRWHFTSHQFRRTVGTILTNAGIRDLIIQKYLRHRNPELQNHYKHLLKKVLGDEYQDLIKEKKWVNIEGKVVATHKPQNVIEEYMRLRMHQITTQVGECHRSNLKESCPTINACWRCGDWRTSEQDLPFLKHDVERLKAEEEKANNLGLVRQAREIQKDLGLLEIRIKGGEEITKND
ncbi:MAG: tyrosine-type recombinase/integrase [Prochloraceae cyanobacterium]|nr:tyrosine-type recombinase/integrase [Prochloraceae cyanobacterium]